MEDEIIIIIGAGAAGLMAARELSLQKKKVVVLEANEYPGGRIRTTGDALFSMPLELGAEFVHGKLTETFRLLRRYKLRCIPVKGTILRLKADGLEKSDYIEDRHHYLEKCLDALQEDLSIDEFIQRYFTNNEHEETGHEIRKFVEGYDLADTSRASTLAFRDEWRDEGKQFRIEGGYCGIVEGLMNDCVKAGVTFHFTSPVDTVHWKPNDIEAWTIDGQRYHGTKLLVTVPVKLLALQEQPGAIRFDPPLPQIQLAAEQIGFGTLIKVFLEFETAFWKEERSIRRLGKKVKKAGFLFCDSVLPTWWTQEPSDVPLLTGWLCGPASRTWAKTDEDTVRELALQTLSDLFDESVHALASRLVGWRMIDWGAQTFAQGAYSYRTVGDDVPLGILRTPIEGTIFFAGEALGKEGVGTVEAALLSAKDAVGLMKVWG